MEKLTLYIKQGKGLGLLFLLAVAVIITFFENISLKTFLKDLEPKAILIAEDFLPIEIKDKQIVSPKDTYKRIDLDLSEKNSKDNDIIPIILDTKKTIDELNPKELKLVFSKDKLYFISPKEIKKIDYIDGSYDINYFKSLIKRVSAIVTSTFTLFFIFYFFINYLLKTILLMLANSIILKINNKQQPNSALMRLSAICIASVELLLFIFSKSFMLIIPSICSLILAFILSWIYLYNNLKTEN